MKASAKGLLLTLTLISLLAGCAGPAQQAAPAATPAPTTAPPAEIEPVQPTMADECPICGMMPAKFPEWRAQILFTDGTAAHFDSPKDMLKYLKGLDNMGMDKTWIEDTSTIAGVFVTDYSTKEYIDARTAHYVKGSDVQGPMGDDVIPFASMDDAMAFAHEHGGEVIGYDAITKDLLKDLKMKMGGMDMGSESMDTGSMDMGGMDMQNEAMGEELVVVGCG